MIQVTIAIIINGKSIAYYTNSFSSGITVHDRNGGEIIAISYDAEKKDPTVKDASGENIPFVMSFWFAWQAFYPDTELWMP